MAQAKNSLRKHLETKKKPTVMLGLVERYLLSQPRDPRASDVLHPSEITKPSWCPREGWYLLSGHTKVEAKPGMQMLSIFEEGHAIHEKWQRWLEGAEILIGAEVPVKYPNYRVDGRADGVVFVDKPYLLEIKSIGLGTLRMNNFPIQGGLSASFRMITRPFNDHMRQAMFYAWVLRQGPFPDLEDLIFLYECKEDQAAREFTAKYDEDWIAVTLEKLATLFPDHDGVLVSSPPVCSFADDCPCEAY
jgi:hypothetical protein